MHFDALFEDYAPLDDDAPAKPTPLQRLELSDFPAKHPVRRFADIHRELSHGPLLPHESEILSDTDAQNALAWAKHFEPVELDGYVDFKVLWLGDKSASRDKRALHDQWLSETIAPEFYDAHYHEIVAVSILRQPRFSRGVTPTAKSYVKVLRGVFPVFAENQARLRLIEIAAEPYAEIA